MRNEYNVFLRCLIDDIKEKELDALAVRQRREKALEEYKKRVHRNADSAIKKVTLASKLHEESKLTFNKPKFKAPERLINYLEYRESNDYHDTIGNR